MKPIFSILVSVICLQVLGQPPVVKPTKSVRFFFTIDGRLDDAEWNKPAIKQVGFDKGNLYYLFLRDTLYLAVDEYADTFNDGVGDRLKIYVDRNGDDLIDAGDLVLTNDGIQDGGLRSYPLAAGTVLRRVEGQVAAGFGVSPWVNYYAHRTWEMLLPLNRLGILADASLSVAVSSHIPVIGERLAAGRYNFRLSLSNISITTLASPGISDVTTDGDKHEKKTAVLPDGGFEIEYTDGSKKIVRPGSVMYITADGRKSGLAYVTAPLFQPPNLPSDANMKRYLDTLQSTLTGTVIGLLKNDAESVNNFLQGDGAGNVYGLIYRRFRFLEFYIDRLK